VKTPPPEERKETAAKIRGRSAPPAGRGGSRNSPRKNGPHLGPQKKDTHTGETPKVSGKKKRGFFQKEKRGGFPRPPGVESPWGPKVGTPKAPKPGPRRKGWRVIGPPWGKTSPCLEGTPIPIRKLTTKNGREFLGPRTKVNPPEKMGKEPFHP